MNNVSYLLKQKMLFITVLMFTLLGCQSFRGSRTPQSAGFGGYCPECLVKNIDKDMAKIQNVVKVANKESSGYTISINEQCKKGYVDGIKTLIWERGRNLSTKQCLKESRLPQKYHTHLDSHCAKNFVEGRAVSATAMVASHKECLDKNNLPVLYETYVKEDCTEGYVQGRLFKREKLGYSLLYEYKQCLQKSALPAKYHATSSCAEGYVKGKRFSGTKAFHEYAECIKK